MEEVIIITVLIKGTKSKPIRSKPIKHLKRLFICHKIVLVLRCVYAANLMTY